ncbi:MAG: hypothetical protein EPO08_19890 [Rhodospirillaceae bacterium]|nr:MAG: hypothetical protein EPO08_19890 [Rhodospirillaceae bacterium]
MRASRIIAATFAIGLVVIGVESLTRGLTVAAPTYNVCADSRLSYPDQGRCAQELNTAANAIDHDQIVARYEAKLALGDQVPRATTIASIAKTNSTRAIR